MSEFLTPVFPLVTSWIKVTFRLPLMFFYFLTMKTLNILPLPESLTFPSTFLTSPERSIFFDGSFYFFFQECAASPACIKLLFTLRIFPTLKK